MATLTLVLVVVSNGVHPELLVAFKPTAGPGAIETDPNQPPEQFAQVEPDSRLDSPVAVRNSKTNRVNRVRTKPELARKADAEEATGRLPQLPPLPATDDEGNPSKSTDSPQAEVLGAPPGAEIAGLDQDAMSRPAVNQETRPKSSGKPLAQPATSAASQANESQYLERLTALQQQMNQLALAQEQHRMVQQTWLDSQQIRQHSRLQSQLDSLESALLAMQEKKAKPTASTAAPVLEVPPPDDDPNTITIRDKDHGTGTMSLDRPVSRRTKGSQPQSVRKFLESIDPNADLNVMFEINVDGNVDLHLREGTAGEVVEALRKSNSRTSKAENPPTEIGSTPKATPMSHERQDFLPPIVKRPTQNPPPRRIR